MTTPRVTVPVDDLKSIAQALDNICDDKTDDLASRVRAMLSAAPAPEGGAVDVEAAWQELLEKDDRNSPEDRPDMLLITRDELADFMALAPADNVSDARQMVEAPAEAVTADSLRSVSDETMRALLSCKDVGSGRAHLASIINAIRAQPPAREDAQPVAWSQDQHDYDALTAIADHLRDNPAAPFSGRQCQEFVQAARDAQFTRPAPDALREEVERLRAALNTPEVDDFAQAVVLEAQHQRERWPSEHDAGKAPLDWFWLVGFLAQKAATAQIAGDDYKAKHHTISTAAALANWHAAISGDHTAMRPGIAPPATESPATPQAEQKGGA